MGLLAEYRDAQREEELARLRRALALRAMVASGMSQRQIADTLGISQSAVSQQLKHAPHLDDVQPHILLEAAAPVLRSLATERGYTRLAAFGSIVRHQARQDSDVDLVVQAPEGTSSFEFVQLQQLIEQVLGRQVDLVSYGGLREPLDGDVTREAVLL